MPSEFEQLEERVRFLEGLVGQLTKTEHYTFSKDLELDRGRNLIFGYDDGTKIGTEDTQKLSLWGVPPIVQPTAPSIPTGGSTIDTQARSWISSTHNRLVNIGIWKV